jgi:hypothetical protein
MGALWSNLALATPGAAGVAVVVGTEVGVLVGAAAVVVGRTTSLDGEACAEVGLAVVVAGFALAVVVAVVVEVVVVVVSAATAALGGCWVLAPIHTAKPSTATLETPISRWKIRSAMGRRGRPVPSKCRFSNPLTEPFSLFWDAIGQQTANRADWS